METSSSGDTQRLVSGMRPTGLLHIGHYYGTLQNWIRLQNEHECFYFVADCHALTTQFDHTQKFSENVVDMVTDWLGAGLDPDLSTLFLQSWVPEHAELFLLLSMIVPLGWLERVPSYKDLKKTYDNTEHDTYGLLGYPLLQSADILMYRARYVPVGEDQVAHIELTREVARRFNHLYGQEEDFEEKIQIILNRLGKRTRDSYMKLRQSYTAKGDSKALKRAQNIVEKIQGLPIHEKMSLLGYLEGQGRMIFPEPQALISSAPKIPGTDGKKMSKSLGNGIGLREDEASIRSKIKTMTTDPNRKRRADPGNPEVCPVWHIHRAASSPETCDWVYQGCTTAGIGCVDCKAKLIEAVLEVTKSHQYRCKTMDINPKIVRDILKEGSEQAREVARETLDDVSHAIKLFF